MTNSPQTGPILRLRREHFGEQMQLGLWPCLTTHRLPDPHRTPSQVTVRHEK